MTTHNLMPENAAIKQRILDRKRVSAQYMIPAYIAQTANFDVCEMVGDQLLMSLTAEVLSEHVESRTQRAEMDVPATWWQHLKRDHAPRWFVSRWPVRYETRTTTVHLDIYRHYPDAKIALPEDKFGRPVIYETTSQTDWTVS